MSKQEQIREYLDGLSNSELLSILSNYCNESDYYDDAIYDNDKYFFDENFQNPMDAVRAAHYGEYRYTDSYVKFNSYGNLETTNDVSDWVDTDEIAAWIVDNDNALSDDDIQDILDEEDDEDSDE